MLTAINTLSITFQYPGLLLILLLATVYYICFWYFKPMKLKIGRLEYNFLFINRFLLMSLLILLIFRPEFSWDTNKKEYKKHLILFDNSLSLGLNDKNYPIKTKRLLADLFSKKGYENKISAYAFGDSSFKISDTACLKFKDRFTDLAGAIDSKDIGSGLINQKFASILVVSDGLFNKGENPLNLKIECPLNTVQVGKSDSSVDLRITDASFPKIVSSEKDNKWEVLLDYNNPESKTFTAKLIISMDKKTISNYTISIPTGSGSLKINANLELPKNQIAEVEILIKSDKIEKNYYNNRSSYYQKKALNSDKILIISSVASLDFYFLSALLKKNGIPFDRINASAGLSAIQNTQYKAVVILNLSNNLPNKFSEQILHSANGMLFFLNSSTSLASAEKILSSDLPANAVLSSVRMEDNNNFGSDFLYNFSGRQISLKNLPEIGSLNGISFPGDRFTPIFNCIYQNRSFPAGWISRNEKSKIAVLNIEDFWRLLFEVNNIADNDQFASYLLNLIEYLGIEGNKQRLTVNSAKKTYLAGEPIKFSGNYYDLNFKEQENERIRIKLNGRKEEIWLSYIAGKYSGMLLVAQPGFYEYTAEVVKNGQVINQKQGNFEIESNNLELNIFNPDSLLLRTLAGKNNGKVIKQDSLNQWVNNLKEVVNNKIIKNHFSPTRSVYCFILIILFFTTEWLWRKIRDF